MDRYLRKWSSKRREKTTMQRVVMEKYLGRRLRRDEHVHHKDGNPLNNSIKNLKVISARDHAQLHMKERGNTFSDFQLLSNIRKVAKRLRRPPSAAEFSQAGYCNGTILKRFGTWNAALELALGLRRGKFEKGPLGDRHWTRDPNRRAEAGAIFDGHRPKGEANGNAKLTETIVRAIRRRYRKGIGADLAREYGVAPTLVSAIVRREIWRHVH